MDIERNNCKTVTEKVSKYKELKFRINRMDGRKTEIVTWRKQCESSIRRINISADHMIM